MKFNQLKQSGPGTYISSPPGHLKANHVGFVVDREGLRCSLVIQPIVVQNRPQICNIHSDETAFI